MKQSATQIEHTNGIDFIGLVQELLGIADYSIYTETVSREQVTAEDGNREFVGIDVNHSQKICFLYHTRDLTDEDVIHELIHVAYPKLKEEEVRNITASLVERTGIKR